MKFHFDVYKKTTFKTSFTKSEYGFNLDFNLYLFVKMVDVLPYIEMIIEFVRSVAIIVSIMMNGSFYYFMNNRFFYFRSVYV